MPQPPEITVQIIHIEGPLKGQIQELNQPQLEIGRHKSCQIKFPADLTIISRKHATITREGNRFKITDHSGNGTLVNSHPIKENYLKDGDVITIAPGGPKFSFLAEIHQAAATVPPESPQPSEPSIPTEPQKSPPAQQSPPSRQTPAAQPLPDYQPSPQPEPIKPAPPQADVSPVPPVASEKPITPFVVQYGPTINSFDTMPVTIGRHPECKFIIDLPEILDHQALINFHNRQFTLDDRTGQQRVLVNGSSIQQETILQHNDEIALSANGPFFRFLEGGRLVEIEKEPVMEPEEPKDDNASQVHETGSSPSKKIKSLFDKFLKH